MTLTRIRLLLCVCVCVCVFTSIHCEAFICLEQLGLPGNKSMMLCWRRWIPLLVPSSLLWNAEPNLSASCFILSKHWSEHCHDLTSIPLAFRTYGLHSPLTGVAFVMHYIVSLSAFASALRKEFAIYLGKVKVTANFSIESSPQQST